MMTQHQQLVVLVHPQISITTAAAVQVQVQCSSPQQPLAIMILQWKPCRRCRSSRATRANRSRKCSRATKRNSSSSTSSTPIKIKKRKKSKKKDEKSRKRKLSENSKPKKPKAHKKARDTSSDSSSTDSSSTDSTSSSSEDSRKKRKRRKKEKKSKKNKKKLLKKEKREAKDMLTDHNMIQIHERFINDKGQSECYLNFKNTKDPPGNGNGVNDTSLVIQDLQQDEPLPESKARSFAPMTKGVYVVIYKKSILILIHKQFYDSRKITFKFHLFFFKLPPLNSWNMKKCGRSSKVWFVRFMTRILDVLGI